MAQSDNYRQQKISQRCAWVTREPLYIAYHDHEWGVPQHDEAQLFEMLLLEGLQAGLSWWAVLKKREHLRIAFDGFSALKIAAYQPSKIEALLQDKNLIRHRLKIQAVVNNARCYIKLCERGGSLHDMVWGLVDGVPIDQPWQTAAQVPVTHPLAICLAQQLKKLGFKYVGEKICYAYLQAVGVFNDHLATCICRKKSR